MANKWWRKSGGFGNFPVVLSGWTVGTPEMGKIPSLAQGASVLMYNSGYTHDMAQVQPLTLNQGGAAEGGGAWRETISKSRKIENKDQCRSVAWKGFLQDGLVRVESHSTVAGGGGRGGSISGQKNKMNEGYS